MLLEKLMHMGNLVPRTFSLAREKVLGTRLAYGELNKPDVVNRTFGNRTQSNPIARLRSIGFGNRT